MPHFVRYRNVRPRKYARVWFAMIGVSTGGAAAAAAEEEEAAAAAAAAEEEEAAAAAAAAEEEDVTRVGVGEGSEWASASVILRMEVSPASCSSRGHRFTFKSATVANFGCEWSDGS